MELYASNEGSSPGSQLIADINPEAADSSPGPLTVIDEQLFFSAEASSTGREGYLSNGNADDEMTFLGDLNTETDGWHQPGEFTQFGDFVYFAANSNQGSSDPTLPAEIRGINDELWRVPFDSGDTNGGGGDSSGGGEAGT